MLSQFLKLWNDWTGDKSMTDAIRAHLRRSGYAAHGAKTRDVHLAAIERPGWVQVWTFSVETHLVEGTPAQRQPILLFGVARNDGRKTGTKIVLSEDEPSRRQQLEIWTEGMLRRPERR